MRETSVAASVVVDMLQYLEGRGIPTAEATRACAIALGAPAESDARIPGSTVERLWTFAEARTGDPLIGLHMAEAYSPGALDIFGYVVLSCRTIGDVLERLARYARVLNDGLSVTVERHGGVAVCRCTFVESMDNYLLRTPRHAIDALWGGLSRELLRMTASPLRASAVHFRRPAPAKGQRAEYDRVFGAPLTFGAADDQFLLPLGHLDQLVLSANPALLRSFEQHADEVLLAMERDKGRSHDVARVMVERLKGTVPQLGEIARELSMSDRNLQRALRNDGTSFQQLLDNVRRDLAIRHLANPATSASQVGFLLGFSEPSAFHRAFRRWTGKAPREYRAMTA
ncbi:MAG: AraC family transcriptional regulator [Gemmatimonadota bacterium]